MVSGNCCKSTALTHSQFKTTFNIISIGAVIKIVKNLKEIALLKISNKQLLTYQDENLDNIIS